MPRVSKGTRKNKSHKPNKLPAKFTTGFLETLDARYAVAKQLRSNYESIVRDLGGEGAISHVRNAVIERFVFLEALLQDLEQKVISGELETDEVIGRWVQAMNSLSGLAKTIGLDRAPADLNWYAKLPADVEYEPADTPEDRSDER
ncbi:hypothetical protein [Crateriforma spongiae]|uniref:hypothetical protein n=1 Tax=Crateriforma spongiae TaxID=2724528 RepID=UPI0014466FDA|nr:hypothetical protein [Crateriforma spongiae]